jgi:hypothetical protein
MTGVGFAVGLGVGRDVDVSSGRPDAVTDSGGFATTKDPLLRSRCGGSA